MLTAVPTSTAAFSPNSPQASARVDPSSHSMDKVAAAAVTPQLVPMTAMPPPHFLINPGTGYTLVPSVTPLNGKETFGSITSLHPMGQFAGITRPVTAIPYYQTPVDLYQPSSSPQRQQPEQTHTRTHPTSPPSVIVSDLAANGKGSPESKPDISSGSDSSTSGSPGNGTLTDSFSGSCEEVNTVTMVGSSPTTIRTATGTMAREAERRVDIKQEPMVTEDVVLSNCTRRNSDSNVEDMSSAAKNSYPISALIDVPTSLTRSSRTSSLSSSLSSFRFGGSLSHLWASQLSLSGKLPNMKSTGYVS